MRAVMLMVAAALTAGETATESLKARDAEIRAALPAEGARVTPEARKKLEAIITAAVDLRGMAQSALGARWQKMTEAQRKRLVGAFEKRFRASSGEELDGYRTTTIDYRPEVVASGVVQVPTRILVKAEPTEVTYTMRRDKIGWRIVDITVDGVSTVENYRSSFARVIAKDGVDGLIQRLERGAKAKAQAQKS